MVFSMQREPPPFSQTKSNTYWKRNMYFLSFTTHKHPFAFFSFVLSLLFFLVWVKDQQAKRNVGKRLSSFSIPGWKKKHPDKSHLSPQDAGTSGHINAPRPGSAPSPVSRFAGSPRSWGTGGMCGCPPCLHGSSWESWNGNSPRQALWERGGHSPSRAGSPGRLQRPRWSPRAREGHRRAALMPGGATGQPARDVRLHRPHLGLSVSATDARYLKYMAHLPKCMHDVSFLCVCMFLLSSLSLTLSKGSPSLS